MSRLLYAGLLRVKKDPLVRVGMVFMFLFGVLLVGVARYAGNTENQDIYLDDIMYFYLPVIALMCAVYCSHLSGQEYCDGAIRNKLIAGHTRAAIYLSNFIMNVVVVLCLWLVTFLTEVVLALLVLDGIQEDIGTLLAALPGSLLALVALCAIFTLIAMSGQNHRASDAANLMLACILLFVSLYLTVIMWELKEYDDLWKNGVATFVDKDEPLYTVIKHRDLYEFFYDFIPSGQIAQYVSGYVKRPERLPLCSVGIIVVTTAFGVMLFQRKNIQ